MVSFKAEFLKSTVKLKYVCKEYCAGPNGQSLKFNDGRQSRNYLQKQLELFQENKKLTELNITWRRRH